MVFLVFWTVLHKRHGFGLICAVLYLEKLASKHLFTGFKPGPSSQSDLGLGGVIMGSKGVQ